MESQAKLQLTAGSTGRAEMQALALMLPAGSCTCGYIVVVDGSRAGVPALGPAV